MVKNSWVHTDGKDGLKEEGWYFLGKNGKTEEGWKNVGDGRYNFDSDGKMRTAGSTRAIISTTWAARTTVP